MSQLDLIIPGLLGPFSDELPSYLQQQLGEPAFNDFRRVLSRSQLTEVAAKDFHASLKSLISPQSNLSICEFTANVSSIDTAELVLYRADPVHFKAESDHAVLLGPELLALHAEETQQLVDTFNQHFSGDNIKLLADESGHWYIQVSDKLDLEFHPLDYALGRDIKHFMPSGNDALWWRRIVNEAQMLFFQHSVNQQREQRGQLTVNGLWLWDQSFDDSTEKSDVAYDVLYSDHLLANCMAQHADLRLQPRDAFSSHSVSKGASLMVVDDLYAAVCYGDQQAWLEALEVFCEGIFNEVYQLLSAAKIKQLNIYSADGRKFSVSSKFRYQFWVANKPLTGFVLQGDQ